LLLGSRHKINPADWALSSKPTAAACDSRMMGQTDGRLTAANKLSRGMRVLDLVSFGLIF